MTVKTPHINPQGVDIAETVLLPGDPLRAKFIAENYLDNVKQFNAVRNMLGFTGEFEGTPVSVMGSGMGIPSISLYSYELIHFFGAKKLIRVGSCGGMQKDLDLYDIVIAQSASTDSRFLEQYNLPGTYAPTGSFRLIEDTYQRAKEQNLNVHVGNILSADAFYNFDKDAIHRWAHMGCLAVEMESAGMYAVAADAKVEAMGIFTVSDNIVTGAETTSEEREKAFTKMMELALPLAKI